MKRALNGWLGFALSGGGYLFGAFTAAYYNPHGLGVAHDLAAYLRAGDDFLAGRAVYVGHVATSGAFNYAPPWVLVSALATLLPPLAVQLAVSGASVAALRYVAGSWRGAGWCLWWPVTTVVIFSGNIDLLIAAAIVAAWRGHPAGLVMAGFAKVAPFLGLPLSSWRRSALIGAVLIVATLPWGHLWLEWIAYLVRQPTVPTYGLAVAWWARLPIALALVALRRPWASALAVVVAMPFLYLYTTMEGLAALRLAFDDPSRATLSPPSRGRAGP